MNQRIKYPLTDEAKEVAQYLVQLWAGHRLEQHFTLINVTAGNASSVETIFGFGMIEQIETPKIAILFELSQFHLIEIWPRTTVNVKAWDILLLQELRNSVATNFDVSDYFLTTQTVGTIVVADQGGNIHFHGAYQSAASNYGDIQQNVETPAELAETLAQILGQDVLKSNAELSEAINDLRLAAQDNRESKVGNVISQLGHALQHTANTVVVIKALTFILPFLSAFLK